FHQFASRRIAGDDSEVTVGQGFKCVLRAIQAQLGFAFGAIGPMARETVFGEDRANIATKFHGGRGEVSGKGPARGETRQKTQAKGEWQGACANSTNGNHAIHYK